MYDKLVIKVNAADTKIPKSIRLVTKTQYNPNKQGLEEKIGTVDKEKPKISGLLKKND